MLFSYSFHKACPNNCQKCAVDGDDNVNCVTCDLFYQMASLDTCDCKYDIVQLNVMQSIGLFQKQSLCSL